MTPLPVSLPPGTEIANYLYPVMDLDDLEQDIMTVRLLNGYYIDVGWYPQHDPSGRFVVRVFLETWDRQQLPQPFETRDPLEVVMAVEKLAEHFSRPQIMLSRAVRSSSVLV